jgi:formiminoglutamase
VSRPSLAEVAVPLRLGSISGGRFDLAPAAIRRALDRFVPHGPDEPGRLMELGVGIEVYEDMDAVALMTPEEAFQQIRRHVGVAIEDEVGRIRPDRAVVIFGGDNSITRPGVHAASVHPGLDRTGLITLDAHHDLRDTDGGLNNGNPVRALLQDGLPGENVVQIGIQPLANAERYAALARETGISVHTVEDVRREGIVALIGTALDDLADRVDAIYVDFDLDVLDRAFAPACPGSRPGGLRPEELLTAARLVGAHPSVRAVDLVEVDPERDIAGTTALTAAACLLWFASGLARRSD